MSKKKKIIRGVKRSDEYKSESNDSAANKTLKSAGQHRCRFCPPWEHENRVQRKPKRGAKKPKYKDKTR